MARGAYGLAVLTGVAHTAVCIPDIDEAVTWYTEVLGLRVLSPPYRMEGDAIERDMRELVPPPVVVTAAIVGLEPHDRVLELVEYPNVSGRPARDPKDASITDLGITHVGLVCDDIDRTRAELESRGVDFLTSGIADVAGLRTAWFRDPWGVVFILVQKGHPDRPYWHQHR
jgi:catechol 2,3-dioxygenase-like lactoylglutathione lyase family enzyme